MVVIRRMALMSGLVLAGLAGCTSLTGGDTAPVLTVQQSRQVLDQASGCCDALATLPYQPLGYQQTLMLSFDASTPAYTFASGKSLFHAFELPRGTGPLALQVTSPIRQQQVFAPELLLLDADYRPVRRYAAETFSYAPPRGFQSDRLTGELTLTPGEDAAYLVVLTGNSARSRTTTLLHPAKVYARARSLAEPDIEDPIARHVATGQVTLDVSPLSNSRGLMAPLLELRNEAPSAARTPAQPVSPQPAQSQAAPTQASEPESRPPPAGPRPEKPAGPDELDYRRAIRAALEAGDIELALELAERAERAGRTGTRAWLADQLKATLP